MASLTICVTDANLWIDLRDGGLLTTVFSLPYRWVAPDLVVNELTDPDGQYLCALGLQAMTLSGVEVVQVATLAATYRRPSIVDLSALVLAARLNAILVTGDGNLRAAAQAEGVTVHGTLWLLDLMVETHRTIPPRVGRVALQAMVAGRRRFPHDEVRRRLDQWT